MNADDTSDFIWTVITALFDRIRVADGIGKASVDPDFPETRKPEVIWLKGAGTFFDGSTDIVSVTGEDEPHEIEDVCTIHVGLACATGMKRGESSSRRMLEMIRVVKDVCKWDSKLGGVTDLDWCEVTHWGMSGDETQFGHIRFGDVMITIHSTVF